AYDADTGKLAWKTYTVPGDPSQPGESEALKQAAKSWSDDWWKAGGGGSAWSCIVYDPDLDLVYVGTGNATPWYQQHRGKGDSQWTASIIALRADTGEQVWGYQTTPGDDWDYDSTQPLMLATLKIDGSDRRVIMQANKNGFFYVIDRQTGKLISGTAYAKMNWATGMDANGRPIENPEIRNMKDAAIVWPSSEGAHNWEPISYNPQTGLVYLAVLDNASLHATTPDWKMDMHDQITGLSRAYQGPLRAEFAKQMPSGQLVAWDPVARHEVWHVDQPFPASGGTLTTAGNLVFQGRADGKLVAYSATAGKPLWQFDTGVGICAGPMTYSVDGTQYVAVMSGWGGPAVLNSRPTGKGVIGNGRLTVYTIGGTGKLEITHRTVPPVAMPTYKLAVSPAQVAAGATFYANYCSRCHGANVVSSGLVPDLRYSTETVHKGFQDIVRGGALHELGMASFADDLTAEQVKDIEGYVLSLAKESAEAETKAGGKN
ncbi:MAG: c-type cytochrome, partial [Candidatus Acidiferrales bacterium]